MQFLRQVDLERGKLQQIKKLHGEIMLEYAYIESLLVLADKRIVSEIRANDAHLAQELGSKCSEAYEQLIIKKTTASSSTELLARWLERVEDKTHCYQGGYGYEVSTSLKDLPHHWVVKEGHYDAIKLTVWEEIAFVISGKSYCLDSELSYQRWGN